jgi:tetratricopeptide (TPR) repeat protein
LLSKKYAALGLQLMPGHAGLHYKMGNVYQTTGRTDSAKIHFRKALEANPSLYMAQYHIGELFMQEKNYQEAINTFSQLRAHDKKLRIFIT